MFMSYDSILRDINFHRGQRRWPRRHRALSLMVNQEKAIPNKVLRSKEEKVWTALVTEGPRPLAVDSTARGDHLDIPTSGFCNVTTRPALRTPSVNYVDYIKVTYIPTGIFQPNKRVKVKLSGDVDRTEELFISVLQHMRTRLIYLAYLDPSVLTRTLHSIITSNRTRAYIHIHICQLPKVRTKSSSFCSRCSSIVPVISPKERGPSASDVVEKRRKNWQRNL
ncbi:hypothetical protein F4678DRAFT_328901 [Xylaria arbuscula]|nr:hypothetical protein F4678DRAFT_328901 [Xylaria arbuscula]